MNLIVAADKNWGIGKDGGLLASLPTDMKYFKEHTMGKVVVMGRKTLESMPGGKGLPRRTNIVMSRTPGFIAEGCTVVDSIDGLFDMIKEYEEDEVFIIGGAALYDLLYKHCDRLYITKIDAELEADTFITDMASDPDFELESESESITENGLTYRFCVYKNISGDRRIVK